MNSLKRQAAKAERFAAVRDELRSRLRVVLASRMALMDAELARLEKEIGALSERINKSVSYTHLDVYKRQVVVSSGTP